MNKEMQSWITPNPIDNLQLLCILKNFLMIKYFQYGIFIGYIIHQCKILFSIPTVPTSLFIVGLCQCDNLQDTLKEEYTFLPQIPESNVMTILKLV